MIGGKRIAHTTPSVTISNITTPNDEFMLVKEFNESRVGQGMSIAPLERNAV
jgi:hypothetical protein